MMFCAADLFFKAVFEPVFVLGCIGLICLWYDYRRDWRFYSVLAILFTGFFWRFALGITTARYALFFVLPFVFLAAYGMRKVLKKTVLFWIAVALVVAGEGAKISISAVRNYKQRRFFLRAAAAADKQARWYCTPDIGSRFSFYAGVPQKRIRRAVAGRKISGKGKIYLLGRYRKSENLPLGNLRLLDRVCLVSGSNPLYLLWGEYGGGGEASGPPAKPHK